MKSEDKLNKALEYKSRVSQLHQMLMNGQIEIDEDNKPPAFQLYVQDFLVGCMQMTGKEIGAYILLLCFQWDKNGLENDPEDLKGIGKCDQETINKIIKKFKTCADGKLRNRRLEKIRAEQIANREQKSKAGIAGNEKRWGNKVSNIDETEIAESRPSSSTSVSINKETGDFFYIGKEIYKIPVSKYINDHLQIFLEGWQIKNSSIDIASVLKKMDSEYVGHAYSGESHIQNTFKLVAKDFLKKGKEKSKREDCPYSDDQLRLAESQKTGGMGYPKWFDKKWEHLLNL